MVRGVGRRRAHIAHSHHAVEHLAPALLRGRHLVGRAEGVVVRRRLRQTGEEARLRQGQIAGVDLEVSLGGGFRAVCPVAVVDAVQVQLENLRLRVAALHLLRQHELVELAADGSRLRFLSVEDIVLDHLLRDRRAAAQPDHGAVLVIQGLDLVAVAVEDTAGLGELRSLQLVDRGQVAGEVVDHRNRGHTAQETDRADREQRDEGCAREPAARDVPPASCAGTRSDPVLQRSR